MAAIKQLYDLQSVDLELDWRHVRLAEIAGALGDESSLVPLRNDARRSQSAVLEATLKQNGLDTIVGGFDEKIAQAEAKLYGGAVKLARELQDLQADIEMIKRQRGEQEDVLLVVLEEIDGAQNTLAEADFALAESQAAWDLAQQAMAEERTVLEAEVAGLNTKREGQAVGVPAPELALYERVRKRHHGKAVARMRENICGSCRVALPNRQAQDARTSKDPVRCPNCGLILLAG
jgi:predicted  nucleic acid-binding Zn-ribbon protein